MEILPPSPTGKSTRDKRILRVGNHINSDSLTVFSGGFLVSKTLLSSNNYNNTGGYLNGSVSSPYANGKRV